MKQRSIYTAAEAEHIVAAVTSSAEKSLKHVSELAAGGLETFWRMKVHPMGCDPLNSESPLNLIEQLNQSFTYIASAKAVRLLFGLHPGLAPFKLNLGNVGGSDIESAESPGLAAEVFAAVNTKNNRKLANDLAKVGRCTAQYKYVFFMCPGYAEGRQQSLESVAGIQVWSVGEQFTQSLAA
jgi:hypothetical protein